VLYRSISRSVKLLKVKQGMASAGPSSSAAMPPVAVRNLVKVYGDVRAVDGISFDLKAGEITALLGGNGAGKTTTIAMLMGLVKPTSGHISIFGTDIALRRYDVLGRMNFESPYVDIPMRLTVRQNLEIFGRLYSVADLGQRIQDVAEKLRISDLLERPYGKLSAGQKTRASLAKSLLNGPELLLLDEPTASLDPDSADWVRETLELYCSTHHATIVLASHNMAEVERLAARVIMMERGRVTADSTPAGLIAKFGRDNLEEVFLDIARKRNGLETAESAGSP
jgi:ABC-2 type transport system ATP-binding protein